MFSTDIVNSDIFLDMPTSSQVLYFHLSMHCDDDGFVYPKKVMRMVGTNDDDLKILISKKFFIPFDSGVVVAKHWRVNNYIRSDRYRSTTHRDEMARLSTDKGMVYHVAPVGIPNGSIGKEVSKKVRRDFSLKKGENTKMLQNLEKVRKNLTDRKILHA